MHGDMYGKRASKDVLFGIAGYGADKLLPANTSIDKEAPIKNMVIINPLRASPETACPN